MFRVSRCLVLRRASLRIAILIGHDSDNSLLLLALRNEGVLFYFLLLGLHWYESGLAENRV